MSSFVKSQSPFFAPFFLKISKGKVNDMKLTFLIMKEEYPKRNGVIP